MKSRIAVFRAAARRLDTAGQKSLTEVFLSTPTAVSIIFGDNQMF